MALASVLYNPSGTNTYTTTSATLGAVDSTHLSISFVAPPSGNVLLFNSQYCSASANQNISFGWMTHPAGATQAVGVFVVTTTGARVSGPLIVTGLTSGTTYQYDLGWAITGGATATISYGAGVLLGNPIILNVFAA